MKKLLSILFIIILFAGCGSKSVFVWTASDIFGLIIAGVLFLCFIGIFLWFLIKDFIIDPIQTWWEKRKNK